MEYLIEIIESPKCNEHVKNIIFNDINWKHFCNFSIHIEKIDVYEKEESKGLFLNG